MNAKYASRRRRAVAFAVAFCLVAAANLPARAQFDLQITISNSLFLNAERRALLEKAIGRAEALWETVIIGYHGDVDIPVVSIAVKPAVSLGGALGVGGVVTTTMQGGFSLATEGQLQVAATEFDGVANYQGPGGPAVAGTNYMDELVAHEIAHALGFGTLWRDNGVYADDFRYVGPHGVAAFQAEFDPAATFIPVESAELSPHGHWDQVFRRSPDEGNPDDPWSLSPLTGIVDPLGRDLALDLMTGALDPDYSGQFLSRTTLESFRDLGYVVAAFEDFNGDGAVDLLDRDILLANLGASGLEVDSIRFGDANRDRIVDQADLLLWRHAAGVPEPGALCLLLSALISVVFLSRQRLPLCSLQIQNRACPVPSRDPAKIVRPHRSWWVTKLLKLSGQ